ncbi:ankyrin repeat-containing domain protein [Rhypophila decipiens]|uniref:Ankyrin repeat-containing domain protein n=1 Tax=Rhypophila decipiens TaxID=261697 RepID=A0AAN6XZF6_9PEZI|nr:ankyrin repeat-containing domain protein [Rhypophila decipiens]
MAYRDLPLYLHVRCEYGCVQHVLRDELGPDSEARSLRKDFEDYLDNVQHVLRDDLERGVRKYLEDSLGADDDDSSREEELESLDPNCWRDYLDCLRIKNVELPNSGCIAAGDAGLYLYLAARRGHLDLAKKFLSKETVSAEVKEFGSTALHAAAEWGHLPMVGILIDGEADVMRRDRSGKTAIEQAMAAGESKILVKKLLKNQDIKAYQEDAYGRWPLHLAVRSANPDIARLLLEHGGVDVNARDRDGMTALHTAVVAGRRSSLQLLLSHGVGVGVVDMQACDYNGRTALHLAAYFRHYDIYKDLVAASEARSSLHIRELSQSRDKTNKRAHEIAESRGIGLLAWQYPVMEGMSYW